MLFDRSGHRTKFTNVGRMLLERGRVLLEAADKLTTDAEALSRGWETPPDDRYRSAGATPDLFPLIEKLATKSNTQLSIITEVLAGAWERLEQGRADIVVAPDMHFRSSSEINSRKLYSVLSVYVAAPDHPIHQEPEPLSEVTRVKYRGRRGGGYRARAAVLTVQLLDKQPRLTVSTIEDKRQALLAGLGVATMPYPLVEKDIAEGRLRVVSRNTPMKLTLSWPGDGTVWAKRSPGVCVISPSCLPADSDEDAPPASGRSRKISRKRVSDRARSDYCLRCRAGS
ncbi:LysR-family transcriptional regulator YhaJ [Klebsiella pneumoniae]|uniref:LysR-family transcriptional regulator YhaJ n=1 Tax=Klebsiella pneumoniae TaxID=573 RepID=A0A377U0T1_KLEPN|nr:LysR-family transcriptional regulator YhaJ [Klebsiella pneumoniae]